MSIRETIDSLGSLSAIDARTAALEAELVAARAGVDDKSASKLGLEGKIARLTESIASMESTRNELTGEMRQTSAQIDRSREKMMRCRNEREANAVQRELEELRRVFREREHETQKIVGLIDAARTDLDAARTERDSIVSELDAGQGEATTRIRQLESALAEQRALREQALGGTDKALLRRYDVVRQRRGSGIAIAKDGMCLSCHISLPPMLHQRILHQAELFQCPSCQRILIPVALASRLTGAGEDGAGDDSESPEAGEAGPATTGDAPASSGE